METNLEIVRSEIIEKSYDLAEGIRDLRKDFVKEMPKQKSFAVKLDDLIFDILMFITEVKQSLMDISDLKRFDKMTGKIIKRCNKIKECGSKLILNSKN